MQSLQIRPDGSAPGRADRILAALERWMNMLAGLAILGIMLLSVANILTRKLLNNPVPAFLDIMVLAVPVMAFLGLAHCQREGGHIRMDVLVTHLRGRALWLFEAAATLLTMLIVGVLIYGSWNHAARALRNGDSTPVAYLPTWPIKALVSVCFAVLLLRLVLQFLGFTRALLRNDPPFAHPQAAHGHPSDEDPT